MIFRTLAVLAFLGAGSGALLAAPKPPPLPARIRAIISHSPVGATAYWGIEIADASTGASVFRSNSTGFFVPASTTKLFTTALTLTRLGPRYRIQTTVTAAQPPDPEGVLSGDLVLKGAGDPSLTTSDIDDLAGQLAARGIHRIDGAIVGDDTAFLWEPYNPGWSIDDAVEGYGAAVSALTLNDNIITLRISPTALSFDPPVPLFTVENELHSESLRRFHYERLPGSPALRLWGALPASDTQVSLGVDDPARYAALVLADALQRKGIQVTGKAQARHLQPGAKLIPEDARLILAQHDSAPLLDDLRVTDKASQNLHAEMYLRLIAQAQEAPGSRAGGLMQLHAFLDAAGVDQEQYSIHDGSGLSRLNLVTPHAVVALLVYMAKSANAEDWVSMLPVAGIDGTLENRLKTKRVKGRLEAKTGSLTHVSALSGYAERRGGKRYAFSILVNNYNGPSSDIRDLIDKICSLLVD